MPLLEVNNLSVSFRGRNGTQLAVDDVSFQLEQGEILGLVGESGSGKSVSCYSLLGLLPMPPAHIDSGEALFNGEDLLLASPARLRQIRGHDIALVFQDPMTCLNPFMRIGDQLIEPLMVHQHTTQADAWKRATELLDEVGIRQPADGMKRFPHEFSGGMRQRVMIAMALIGGPSLLIADEPTTALDVSVQAQILALLAELRKEHDIGVIFVSHDLAVVREVADKLAVMQNGVLVEQGPVAQVFDFPAHDYTRELLSAVPKGAKQQADLSSDEILVRVSNLLTTFSVPGSLTKAASKVVAVNNVSFDIRRGEILGLVGESGSGKSTLGRSILRLLPVDSGSVLFDGEELIGKPLRELQTVRKRMQMIFQDPYASLNPRMTIYDTLAEPLLFHGLADRSTVQAQVMSLMDEVGLARRFVRKYPHEFSGGQRQRIAIGRALAVQPDFIVADEPVSALDVTVQHQILSLLLDLVQQRNLTVLFISHDLSVVRQVCDRVMVMQQGELLENGATEEVWKSPQHPYTKTLLDSALQF